MSAKTTPPREGSLEAPTRHAIDWKSKSFWDKGDLLAELERVFDHCHGCRRCVSLCNAFPTLFDLVDESETMEVDGVAKADYWKVVDHCYLCDLCFLTKCPYTPPHEWNIDFPHLMLRAKAVRFRQEGARVRDRIMTATDALGGALAHPVIAPAANAAARSGALRKAGEAALDVDHRAWLPPWASRTLRSRLKGRAESADGPSAGAAVPAGPTTGKVALFATCYGNFNEPHIGEDLVAVLEHNGVSVRLAGARACCGMPKLELGDLEAVERLKEANIPALAALVDEGCDILAPVPSCALMFRQELPLLFPEDADVAKVARAIFDPFEYLHARHKAGKLNTDFKTSLGKVAYHTACHQRVQNVGPKTRQILELVPGTEVVTIERCSGHDGTYAMKAECHDASVKIVRPVARRVREAKPQHLCSDCPMAAHHIAAHVDGAETGSGALAGEHPITLLRKAYGL